MDWNCSRRRGYDRGQRSQPRRRWRARAVPLLVKLRADLDCLEWGAPAILAAADATGRLIVHPDAATQARYCEGARRAQADAETAARHLPQPAHSADGERILLYLNVDDPAALAGLDPTHCDGIGLTRTEFLFQTGLADEDRQYHAYRRLLEWARGRPVTIRTLDAGGDKPIPRFHPAHEDNPFLGVRGIRCPQRGQRCSGPSCGRSRAPPRTGH
ncbi:MAG: putative PEP-binding protein [Gammaproteobacteria bacterium]